MPIYRIVSIDSNVVLAEKVSEKCTKSAVKFFDKFIRPITKITDKVKAEKE